MLKKLLLCLLIKLIDYSMKQDKYQKLLVLITIGSWQHKGNLKQKEN